MDNIKNNSTKASDWGETDLAYLIIATIFLWATADSNKGENNS